MNESMGLIIEGLKINEAKKSELIKGQKFVLISSLIVRGSFSGLWKNGKENNIFDDKYRYTDDFIDRIEKASKGKFTITKDGETLKLTPGCEVVFLDNYKKGDRYCNIQIGDSDIVIDFDVINDLGKIDLNGKIKEKHEVEYALYGTPDIYGRADTQWHWAQRDYGESEKEFKNSVKYSAKRCAEREYREYNPNSIKVRYFSSKDEFLKTCSKVGLNPRLD